MGRKEKTTSFMRRRKRIASTFTALGREAKRDSQGKISMHTTAVAAAAVAAAAA